MQTSNDTAEIFAALIAARAELANPALDRKGHGYDYASLPAIIDQVTPVLAAHGLGLVQSVGYGATGAIVVSSRLIHVSGQWIEDGMELPPAHLSGGAGSNPVQCMGASITYGRRYQLTAMLNICGDRDTDASGYTEPAKAQQAAPPQPKPKQQQQPKPQQTQAQAPQRQAAPADDWRAVQIHFGKNKGTALGDLPGKSLEWYVTDWQPKPFKGEISAADTMLRAALDAAAYEFNMTEECVADEEAAAAEDDEQINSVPF